jgi:drug/metabolite transporter (DMT)-like permease
MQVQPRERRAATAGGILAIALWSCTVAASRELSETLGATTAAATMLLLGGALGCVHAGLIERRLGAIFRLARAYLVGCGLLFVAYMVCLYLAIGLSASRQQAIEIGIINYLWPGLTLLFSVPITRTRVRWTFVPGVVLALLGAVLAPLRLDEYSFAALGHNLLAHPLPYVLALGAALSWALYSVLSRRWGAAGAGAVPIFTLAAGIVLAAVRLGVPERATWTGWAMGLVLFMAVCPILVAYSLWDRAMRRGNMTLVAALSNFAPLLSTAISAIWLRVALGWSLWLACGLVVAGAALCQRSVIAHAADAPLSPG